MQDNILICDTTRPIFRAVHFKFHAHIFRRFTMCKNVLYYAVNEPPNYNKTPLKKRIFLIHQLALFSDYLNNSLI